MIPTERQIARDKHERPFGSDVYLLELAGTDDAFAAYEAASVADGVRVIGGGVATAHDPGDRISQLALTHRVSELVGTATPTVESASETLATASIDRSGSVAVRARDVRGATGLSTQTLERELGSILVDRGFTVDLDAPDHELRALVAGPPTVGSEAQTAVPQDEGICALGWLAHEPDRGFTERAPTDRPFFQPGSMDPALARALVNIAGARPGVRVLDPMCGTGGLLIEAGLVGARTLGVDTLSKMVRGTQENLAALVGADVAVCRGDARRLPFEDDAVDAVVFDAPYGRQTKITAETLTSLLADALAEARRLAPRAVVVGDRSWADVATEAGWTVEAHFQRRVHRSLDRHVHVLERA